MIQLLKLPYGIATLLAAVYFNAHHVAAGPSVNVGMKAAFPAPPFLLELLYVVKIRCGLVLCNSGTNR